MLLTRSATSEKHGIWVNSQIGGHCKLKLFLVTYDSSKLILFLNASEENWMFLFIVKPINVPRDVSNFLNGVEDQAFYFLAKKANN